MPDIPEPRHDDTGIDHGEVDERLRAAGQRLRASAPAATPQTARSSGGGGRRRPFIAGIAVGAIAAAVVALLVVLPGRDESVRDVVPSDTSPNTEPGTPPTSPTSAPSATLAEPEPDEWSVGAEREILSARDWDGNGGGCFAIVGVDGNDTTTFCVTGDMLGREITLHLATTTAAFRWSSTPMSAPDDDPRFWESESGVSDGDVCGVPADELPVDRWVEVVTCSNSGPLFRHLPRQPGEATVYTVATPPFGGPVTVAPVPADVPDGVLAFAGEYEVGITLTCQLLVGPERDGWAETCRTVDEEPWDRLVRFGDDVFTVIENVERVTVTRLGDDEFLWPNGCVEPLAPMVRTVTADLDGSMMGTVACDGDRASATFGSVLLQIGPRDGGFAQLEREPGGDWERTDIGSGLEPDPWPVPMHLTDPQHRRYDVNDLPMVEVTDEWRELAGSVESSEMLVTNIFTGLGFAGGTYTGPGAIDGAAVPLVILFFDYPDDSVTSGVGALWYREGPGGYEIDRAFLVDRCGRGVTELDGRPVCL